MVQWMRYPAGQYTEI